MKKSIVFLFALISFAACDLTKLEPAQTKSFMKYFGDAGKTYGEDLLKLEDGYLLLGNNYSSEDRTGPQYSVLVKTDLNGNTMWTAVHNKIEGRSLALASDGYFIVGDEINNTNSKLMMLIKTNLDGSEDSAIDPTALGLPLGSHGTGITIDAMNEVVVSGYITTGTGTDETFLYGFNSSDLSRTWNRTWSTANTTRIASRTLQEIESPTTPGEMNFIWTNLVNAGSGNYIESYRVRRDEQTPVTGDPILGEYNITNELGDFKVVSTSDAAIVQSASNNGGTQIVFSQQGVGGTFNPVVISPPDPDGKTYDYTANSVVKSRDGSYVVLGSTTSTGGDATRSDTDYFIKKVAYNGTELSDGFTLTFGGTAEEYGTKIIQADDDGYVFIGTHENPNEVDFMVLVKITKDGKLIN